MTTAPTISEKQMIAGFLWRNRIARISLKDF
jgi:hypothetical protein